MKYVIFVVWFFTFSVCHAASPVTVHEITMVTPDIICVEVRDEPSVSGLLVQQAGTWTGAGSVAITNVTNNGSGAIRITAAAGSFSSSTWNNRSVQVSNVLGTTEANGSYQVTYIDTSNIDLVGSTYVNTYVSGGTVYVATPAWVTATNPTGYTNRAKVVGPKSDWLRFTDVQPINYLNRAAADVAGNWSITGSDVTVNNVYRKSIPYDGREGYGVSGSNTVKFVSMQHFIYLKLSANLPQGGPYTIVFPVGTGLPNTDFTFNDTVMRAQPIKLNQVGFSRDDTAKTAFFSVWIPGYPGEGAVDLSVYGLNNYQIIDDNGWVHYSGKMTLRVTPTQVEPYLGISAGQFYVNAATGNYRYSSTNSSLSIIGATQTNPVKITTSAPHGLSNGSSFYIHNMGSSQPGGSRGMGVLNDLNYIAANVTADTIDLTYASNGANVNGTGFTAYNGPGTLYPVTESNQASTYVWEMDFSAWRANKYGVYRVRVPGLGVSDPFRIDAASWFKIAANLAAGEYQQRNGIAKDSRFGWATPVNFKDGTGDFVIMRSALPQFYGSQNVSFTPNFMPAAAAAYAPWVTTERMSGLYGGWASAGDYNTDLVNQGVAAAWLLISRQLAPVAAKAANFNIPYSNQVLDSSIYTPDTNGLAQLTQQAIWQLDFFRRTQQISGVVADGFDVANDTTNVDPSPNIYEPSWISRGRGYIYAGSHAGTFIYAGLAAALAKDIEDQGFQALANVWKTSAIAAWTFANSLYTDYAARDTYYNTTLGISTKANWNTMTVLGAANNGTGKIRLTVNSTVSFATNNILGVHGIVGTTEANDKAWWITVVDGTHIDLDNIWTAGGGRGAASVFSNAYVSGGIVNKYIANDAALNVVIKDYGFRNLAAAALFKLTGEIQYDNAYKEQTCNINGGACFLSSWIYINTPGADSTITATLKSTLTLYANYFKNYANSATTAYRLLRYGNAGGVNANFGNMGSFDNGGMAIVYAYGVSCLTVCDTSYITALKHNLNHWHGANQTGDSLVTGIGIRTKRNILYHDYYTGVFSDPPPGKVIYAYTSPGAPFSALNWQYGPINNIIGNPDPTYENDFELERVLSHYRFAFPIHEAIFNNRYVIAQMEFTVQQSLIPALAQAALVWGFDGNTATEYSDRRFGWRAMLDRAMHKTTRRKAINDNRLVEWRAVQ